MPIENTKNNMIEVLVQYVDHPDHTPDIKTLSFWVTTVLEYQQVSGELTLRIVNPAEMRELNRQYRHRDKPTNVLSFPFDNTLAHDLELPLLGDIVICAEIVKAEAQTQHKDLSSHWAHLVVHGCLHLLGYDHEQTTAAEQMEALETILLNKLGFSDPYKQE